MKKNSARLAAAVAHKALHCLQLDLERRFGFDAYRFTESAGRLVSGNCEAGCADYRDLWLFRGQFTDSSNQVRTYEMLVGIRAEDEGDGLRWERLVDAEVLNPNNGGFEYKIEVPALGEMGHVTIKEVGPIDVPDPVPTDPEDIFSIFEEIASRDHVGQKDPLT